MVSLIANPRSAEKLKNSQMPYIMSVKSACLVVYSSQPCVTRIYVLIFRWSGGIFCLCSPQQLLLNCHSGQTKIKFGDLRLIFVSFAAAVNYFSYSELTSIVYLILDSI